MLQLRCRKGKFAKKWQVNRVKNLSSYKKVTKADEEHLTFDCALEYLKNLEDEDINPTTNGDQLVTDENNNVNKVSFVDIESNATTCSSTTQASNDVDNSQLSPAADMTVDMTGA